MEDVKHKEEVRKLDSLLKTLFEINRSLTGEGNRRTFDLLQEIIPLKVLEYACGCQMLGHQVRHIVLSSDLVYL